MPWPREAAVSPRERETAALPPLGPGSEHGAGLRSRLIMVSGGMMDVSALFLVVKGVPLDTQ